MSSSSDFAVRVDRLNKLYRIGTAVEKSENLVSAFANVVRSPLRNYKKYRSLYNFNDVDFDAIRRGEAELGSDLLWAIRDMTFDVPAGQVLGIIGHNGAGKSTLLKILSRITSPTRGKVEIQGRLSSLLEVGTGFHNELTGRENVYLNGTILGMRKREVDREFDAIVEFSGVERFLDTPVKRYSTGMKVRLAFAVAAHLRPEILIVDEVLSVGDAEFQRKCMGKMEAIGEEGRTILFVSHNMPAVTRMCHRVLMVEQGQIIMDGTPHDVVSTYLRSGKGKSSSVDWANQTEAPGGDIARLRAVSIRDESGEVSDSIDIRRPVFVQVEFDCLREGHVLMPSFSLWNDEGFQLFTSIDLDPDWRAKYGHRAATSVGQEYPATCSPKVHCRSTPRFGNGSRGAGSNTWRRKPLRFRLSIICKAIRPGEISSATSPGRSDRCSIGPPISRPVRSGSFA